MLCIRLAPKVHTSCHKSARGLHKNCKRLAVMKNDVFTSDK